jgi:hypothetical protein
MPPATKLRALRPTVVFDAYWRFAAERHSVFLRRLMGLHAPWTQDRVLQEYKFTNAFRASDRVSQYLIRRVIYRDDLPANAQEVVFRVLLFKLFNKIATWEYLQAKFGAITLRDFRPRDYEVALSSLKRDGSIYSGAYIIPSPVLGFKAKHQNHLMLLDRMFSERIGDRIANAHSLEEVYQLLRGYPGIGPFLAFQFAIDINYSEVIAFDESDFVVAGPGALSGIQKCFGDTTIPASDLIRIVADEQAKQFDRLNLSFGGLWGRPLQLIDCQNLFCETDKYSRVMFPSVIGRGGRRKIKRRLSPLATLPVPWYPPKWRINDRIAAWSDSR